MTQTHRYWLLTIFLLTLTLRLLIAFAMPNFTHESYFHLRQVDHLSRTGLPLYHDELSYSGRAVIFLPLFHYFMAFFDLWLPLDIVATIVPNLLLASITLLVYVISKKITGDTTSSLFASVIGGFLPILFTPNTFTVTSLFLPLLLLLTYCFLRIEETKFLYLYIVTLLLLSFTSSATVLILVGFGLYLLLSLLEGKTINRAELELIIFSLFFFVWSQFLFFKNIFLTEGIAFLWKNVPPQIVAQYFPKLSLFQAIFVVGIIPFLVGIYVVYRSLFKLKTEKSFFLISLAISTTILAWLRLIEFKLSLSFLGLIVAVLFASFYRESAQYLRHTKLTWLPKLYPGFIFLLIAMSTIYPALVTAAGQQLPKEEETAAFQWLKINTPPDSGVAALIEEGHLVTFISQRRNLMDDQFGLVPNVEQRFEELTALFTTSFETEALGILDKYQINYLVLTTRAQNKYDLHKFKYATPACFRKVYDEQTRIYKVKCSLKKST